MKNKIIGILVCMLLITTALPAVGSIVNDNLSIRKTSDDYNNLMKQISGGSCSRGGWSEQDKLTASDGAHNDYFGMSFSIDGDYAIVGAWGDDDHGYESGAAYIFKRDGTSWEQEDKLTASDGAHNDRFGCSVAIDGDYAIVGAFGDRIGMGSAYIFKRSGTSWEQEDKLTASDGDLGDHFGNSVSINEDYVIIGAVKDDGLGVHSGSAYVFKHSSTSWVQEDKLTASDGATDDLFGGSVAIDGDYAIVGATEYYVDGGRNGSAYVFKRNGTSWEQEEKLTASDGAADDRFGCSVSIDGDYAIVGAYWDNDSGLRSGSAYIFKRNGTSWGQEEKLTASDGEYNDVFGVSVSIDGDYAIVGAYGDNDSGIGSGSAYVFKHSGTSWVQEDKLTASDGAANEYFGMSVSIDGDYAIVGAPHDDDSGSASGSAYVFKKQPGPDLDCDGSLSWTDVEPGATVTGNFTISNIGDPGTELDWEIELYPEWGSWTFTPDSGIDLTPEDGALTVDVEVIAPDEYNTEYTGEVSIINSNNPNNSCIISTSLITINKPQPDLECSGSLSWIDVTPGDVIEGNITISNIGDPGTELDWEIESYPEWGIWTFTPSSGDDLTPEDAVITVEVKVVAPDDPETEFEGEVKIVNSDDPDDYCIIDVSLATPQSHQHPIVTRILQFFENLIHRFPLIERILEQFFLLDLS